MPAALKVSPVQLVQLRHDLTRVSSYSIFGSIAIPRVVMESLHYFDGRRLLMQWELLPPKKGILMDGSLVRKMVDFGLLAPAE